MIPHDVPDAPWVKVASDLFTLNNRDYVLLVDFHSTFIAVSRLEDTKSSTVIKAIKNIFSIHGIPKILFSDNGPQYVSKEFRNFNSTWDIEHDSSSPEYLQTNCLVEREIQTVKRIMCKAEENSEDPYLGLLNLNVTPLKDGFSPAESRFNRRVRTLLPSMKESSKPSSLPKQSRGSHEQYDRGDVELKPISPQRTVRIYSKEKKNWGKKGKVVSKSLQPRSYNVLNENNNVIRRNRRDLIPTNEKSERQIDDSIVPLIHRLHRIIRLNKWTGYE